MRVMKDLSVAVAVLSVALSVRATEYFASSSASAAEEHDCLSEGTAGTIVEAFGKATTDGDIVTLLDGTYDMTKFSVKSTVINTPKVKNTASPSYLVGKNAITVRSKSGDRAAVTLLGGGTAKDGRCFWFNAAATISGLTVTNFYSAKAAAAVYSENRSLFVTNCVLNGNRSAGNNAVAYRLKAVDCEMNGNYVNLSHCIGEELDLVNCTFDNNGANGGNNWAEYAGCMVFNSSLTNCTFRYLYLDGTAGTHGGTAVSACALTNCTFRDTKINYTRNNQRMALCHKSTLKGCHFRNLQLNDYSGGCLDQSTAEDCVFTNVVNYFGQQGSCTRNTLCRHCWFFDNILTNVANGLEAGGGACFGGSFYDCTFIRNKAVYTGQYSETHGGAISGFSVISNCVFVDNQARYGGAVAARTSSFAFDPNAMIYDSYFTNNLAVRVGGAVYGATLRNCVIHGCEVTGCTFNQGGGGAYNCRSINSLFEYCKLAEASGDSTRGGGAQYGGSAVNCIFRYNTETNAPGATLAPTAAACDNMALTNCLFYGNYAPYASAAGSAIVRSTKPVVNCTIVSNTVSQYAAACIGPFVNCILVGNGRDIFNSAGTHPSSSMTNCIYQTIHTGSGSSGKTVPKNDETVQVASSEDVRFASLDPASENAFRLRHGSPARNAGADVGFTAEDVDLAGNPRVVGGTVDMGCYEYFNNNGLLIILK